MEAQDFGTGFTWGVSSSAYQTEGAYLQDGKGLSIWDVFTTKGKTRGTGQVAADFYNRYMQDVILMDYLGIRNFRFSLSWPRLFPEGKGWANAQGISFYNRLIDFCLECKIEPWITLYHWDLPQALQEKGGWTNRSITGWFGEYVQFCAKLFGDRVKNWMVLNEPLVFTGAGHFMGIHAPGKKGLEHFLPAVHHAALCQALGGRILKSEIPDASVGTTFSFTHIDPLDDTRNCSRATTRMDVIANRLFLEPLLGLGYPWADLPMLNALQDLMHADDEEALYFPMDFIGVQNYTREVVRYSRLMPYLNARPVKAEKRGVPVTDMGWEIYPQGLYHTLKKVAAYKGVKKIIITECGAAFKDKPEDGIVHDPRRIAYMEAYLAAALAARSEGVPLKGFFAWSLTDNFEWAEGYDKRFGLIYVDYKTQRRTVKSSGHWYREFLARRAVQKAAEYPFSRKAS